LIDELTYVLYNTTTQDLHCVPEKADDIQMHKGLKEQITTA